MCHLPWFAVQFVLFNTIGLFPIRSAAVPQWDSGAHAPALVQAGEGLPHEEWPLWHQQNSRHLWLYEVWHTAQQLSGLGEHAGALPAVSCTRWHHHSSGRAAERFFSVWFLSVFFFSMFSVSHVCLHPQEYGISKMEKLDISSAYCLPLVKKIQLDLQRTHEDEAVNKLHPLWASGPHYNIIH